MQASNTQLAAIVTKLQAICDALGLSSPLIADDFDPAVSYSPGDYCIKDGTLYRCNTATTADAPWDITEWTATSVTQEFIRLQAILGDEDISAIGDGTVTGAITTLNSTLAGVAYGTVDNKIMWCTSVKTCMIKFADGTYTANANEIIATLPANCKPYVVVDFRDSYSQKRFFINTNGDIITVEALSNATIRGTVTYILS